jgi:hypothetical protein
MRHLIKFNESKEKIDELIQIVTDSFSNLIDEDISEISDKHPNKENQITLEITLEDSLSEVDFKQFYEAEKKRSKIIKEIDTSLKRLQLMFEGDIETFIYDDDNDYTTKYLVISFNKKINKSEFAEYIDSEELQYQSLSKLYRIHKNEFGEFTYNPSDEYLGSEDEYLYADPYGESFTIFYRDPDIRRGEGEEQTYLGIFNSHEKASIIASIVAKRGDF